MMIMLNKRIAPSPPLPRLSFAKSWHIWSPGLNPRHANHSRLWMLIAWKGSRSKGTPFKEGSCKMQWVHTHRTPPEWKYHKKIKTDVELEQDETGARSNKLVSFQALNSAARKFVIFCSSCSASWLTATATAAKKTFKAFCCSRISRFCSSWPTRLATGCNSASQTSRRQ